MSNLQIIISAQVEFLQDIFELLGLNEVVTLSVIPAEHLLGTLHLRVGRHQLLAP